MNVKISTSSFFLAFFLTFNTSCAQNENLNYSNAILQSAIDINYTSENDSLDFSALDNLIGNKEIVIIGEAGHGDGRSFEVKTKIINHLVNNKGFNTLALEGAGFLDMMIFNNLYHVDTSKYKESMNLHYAWNQLWSHSKETEGVQKLILEGKITAIGIENQGTKSTFYLPNFLRDFLIKNNIDRYSNEDWKLINQVNRSILLMDSSETVADEDIEYCENVLISIMETLKDSFKHKDINDKTFFKSQVLIRATENLLSFYKQFKLNWYTYEGQNKGINVRDREMAENLIWYKNNNKSSKIIVWTANFHAAKDLGDVKYNDQDPELYKEFVLFGDYISSEYPDNVYSLAISSAEGTAGTIYQKEPIEITLDEASIEGLLSENEFNYTIIPFDQIIENYPYLKESVFHSQILAHNSKPGKWFNVFNGLLFIKFNKHATTIEE